MKATRRIIAVDLLCDLGNRLIGLILLDILVFNSPDPHWHLVGLTLAEQMPALVFSHLAGTAADRLGADLCLIVSLALKLFLTTALLIYPGDTHLITLYFCFMVSSLIFNLGRLAIVPTIVVPQRLIAFNSLNERLAMIGGIVAYALLGPMVAIVGQDGALQLAACVFVIALATLKRLSRYRKAPYGSSEVPKANSKPSKNIAFQTSATSGRSLMGHLLYVLGALMLAGGVLNFTLPLVFKEHLGGQIALWGILMALFQGGAMTAAFSLPYLCNRFGMVVVLTGATGILACTMTLTTWGLSSILMGGVMFVLGNSFLAAQIILESLIQQNAPSQARGRMAARVMIIRGICFLVAGLSGAVVWNCFSFTTLILGGSLSAATATWMATRLPSGCQSAHNPT